MSAPDTTHDDDPEFRQSSLDRLDLNERARRWPVPTRDVTAENSARFDREHAAAEQLQQERA